MVLDIQRKVTVVAFHSQASQKEYLSAKHVLLFKYYLFYYLQLNYFLNISAYYIPLERDFISEYSAINLIKLLPLSH